MKKYIYPLLLLCSLTACVVLTFNLFGEFQAHEDTKASLSIERQVTKNLTDANMELTKSISELNETILADSSLIAEADTFKSNLVALIAKNRHIKCPLRTEIIKLLNPDVTYAIDNK